MQTAPLTFDAVIASSMKTEDPGRSTNQRQIVTLHVLIYHWQSLTMHPESSTMHCITQEPGYLPVLLLYKRYKRLPSLRLGIGKPKPRGISW